VVEVPLAKTAVEHVRGTPLIRATIVLGIRQLRLYTVHMVAPLGDDRVRWRDQLRHIHEATRHEHGSLVVAGDFNATRCHSSFRRLLSDRLADAHERRGRGWATTWPRNRWLLPPLMRLDHVLVSPEIGVRSVREGIGQGSDHRPIIATSSYCRRRYGSVSPVVCRGGSGRDGVGREERPPSGQAPPRTIGEVRAGSL
jgi:endonuclease/exonuclease/phosphatase (EEP) superfamily protein YafD